MTVIVCERIWDYIAPTSGSSKWSFFNGPPKGLNPCLISRSISQLIMVQSVVDMDVIESRKATTRPIRRATDEHVWTYLNVWKYIFACRRFQGDASVFSSERPLPSSVMMGLSNEWSGISRLAFDLLMKTSLTCRIWWFRIQVHCSSLNPNPFLWIT